TTTATRCTATSGRATRRTSPPACSTEPRTPAGSRCASWPSTTPAAPRRSCATCRSARPSRRESSRLVAEAMLDAASRRNVWKRIEGEERPAWSDVTSTGTFRIDPGQTFDRHYHDCDEYWFIREGRAIIEIDDERYAVEAGDIVCTEIGREHDFLQVLEP